jgi:ABC-type branched-subunit amino acid transport system substrate-binding protein
MTTRRTSTALAAGSALALTLTLAACGGDEKGGTAGGGETVTIMAFGSFSNPPFVLPEIVTGAQAAVDRVNADGGVGGRQLELLTCDDEGNPNGAAACGRKAVEEDVAAVVGAFTLFGDSVIPLLERGKIPYVLPTAISTMENNSPVSFPVGSGATASAGALTALAESGCRQVAALNTDVAPARFAHDAYVVPAAEAAGIEVEPFYVPVTTTDIGPTVSQALASGADCFQLGVGAQLSSSALVSLAQSGASVTSGSNALALPESILAQIPKESRGFLAVSNYAYPSTGDPVALQVQEDMAAIDPDAPVNDASINAYAAVLVFQQAAEGLDEITGAAVLEALDGMDTIDVGLFPAADLADAGFISDVPRLAASTLRVYRAENGAYVPSDQADVDLSSVFAD